MTPSCITHLHTSSSTPSRLKLRLPIALASFSPSLAYANPSSDIPDIYDRATQGNTGLLEKAYERLKDTLQQDGSARPTRRH